MFNQTIYVLIRFVVARETVEMNGHGICVVIVDVMVIMHFVRVNCQKNQIGRDRIFFVPPVGSSICAGICLT